MSAHEAHQPNEASATDWDRVARALGEGNLERLAAATVGVVGVGSGGSFVALSLAMSGVGRFVLVDDDALEPSNIVRHAADLRDLGRNKAAAVADLIRQRNPRAVVEVVAGRIEAHMDALDRCDLLIVGVDGEGAKYALNEACLERDLTAIYAGVYERGEGGDVVIIRPYDGPCYACWAAELREGLFQPTASENLDYGMIGPAGTLEAEPGLWIHVAKVAAIQADFALNELLGRPRYPANTLIIANAAMEIIDGQVSPPHSSVWVEITRDPHCLVCGDQIRAGAEAEAEAHDAVGGALSLGDLALEGLVIEDSVADDKLGDDHAAQHG
jgi:molybdopterin/thiamine biosynthesis adenylyltransferase